MLLLAAVALAFAIHQSRLRDALLRLPPDATPNVTLAGYAANRARTVYRDHCAGCHGADMKGDRRIGVPDLTDREWLYGDGRVSEIEQTILYGIRSGHHRSHDQADMPAFALARPYRRYALPTLSRAQIGDLADYLRSRRGRPVDHVAAARGAALFAGAPQCYDCHTSDASGDNFAGAPSLVDRVQLYGSSRDDLIRSIAWGRAGTCPAWVGRLTSADIKALAVYISAVARGERA